MTTYNPDYDLDISKYTDCELLHILEIQNLNPSKEEIETKIEILQSQVGNNQTIREFFNNILLHFTNPNLSYDRLNIYKNNEIETFENINNDININDNDNNDDDNNINNNDNNINNNDNNDNDNNDINTNQNINLSDNQNASLNYNQYELIKKDYNLIETKKKYNLFTF